MPGEAGAHTDADSTGVTVPAKRLLEAPWVENRGLEGAGRPGPHPPLPDENEERGGACLQHPQRRATSPGIWARLLIGGALEGPRSCQVSTKKPAGQAQGANGSGRGGEQGARSPISGGPPSGPRCAWAGRATLSGVTPPRPNPF